MKKIVFLSVLVFSFFSCDKIENPYKPEILLDTTLYADGNWETYPWPEFEQNTNTNRNILLEDYTGHKCPNCPAAAIIAKNIESANPERVFVAGIHTGKGGHGNFQVLSPDCGESTNPLNKYCHDFRIPEANEYGFRFGDGFGFVGNPFGNISRITFDGLDMFQFQTEWETLTNQALTENDLKVNIQAKSNYYPSTNGVYLHTEVDILEDLPSNYNMVVYVLRDKFVSWQDDQGTDIPDYEHHNTLIACIDGLPWGQNLGSGFTTGAKFYKDFSYKLPDGLTNDDLHFLVYVYDVETYEILQVIKHKF